MYKIPIIKIAISVGILSNEFRNYNGEILKLKFNIKNLESEIDYWKDKAYYYKLLLSFSR